MALDIYNSKINGGWREEKVTGTPKLTANELSVNRDMQPKRFHNKNRTKEPFVMKRSGQPSMKLDKLML